MTRSPLALAREDLREFAGYASARRTRVDGEVWLNANESPWPNQASGADMVRRYPEPQPSALRGALAELYGCDAAQLLVGRGSDEGIDLLVRALCRPGADAVLVTPPTFGMYAVGARLHGTRVVEVPLLEGEDGYRCDFTAVGRIARTEAVKLVFLCSPGNPTGNLLPLDAIEALAGDLQERAVVVVDEAYLEYARQPSSTTLLGRHRNIAVLRTLSKAHALAAARIGSVIADAELIALLQRCQSPYPLPAPCSELAGRALARQALEATEAHVATIVAERGRLLAALETAPQVHRIYPSSANFLLVRFADASAVYTRLLAAGIVVRDLRAVPGLPETLRITIGTPAQNSRVLRAVATAEATA